MLEFTPETVLLLWAAAAFAGFVDAIAGGGGLIVVPALMAAGVSPVGAIATNKVQGFFGTASAALSFTRAGLIEWRRFAWPVMAALFGSGLGGVCVTRIDPAWLVAALPILLGGVAGYFLLAPSSPAADRSPRLRPASYAAVAGVIGFYDGFFGPGGGAFFVASLVSLLGMGMVRATAHAKALNVATNVTSVAVFGASGQVLWSLGLVMAVGQVAGGWLGSRAALRCGPALIRGLLVAVCLAVAAKILWTTSRPGL